MYNNYQGMEMAGNAEAGVYESVLGGSMNYGGSLFAWITLTMVWVFMILAITALAKYILEDKKKRR